MQTVGKLILLPNLLDDAADASLYLPAKVPELAASLQGLIAESEKAARRYLRRFLSHEAMAALPLKVLNEHSSKEELSNYLEPMLRGETWGLLSDAGLSCIADPGSDLVAKAHEKGVAVQTIPGPTSILMALQLSGFSGQNFAFHGYLPRETPLLEKRLVELEKRSHVEKASQIWIEVPYRSAKMLESAKTVLQPSTRLCVAAQLTSSQERCLSLPIAAWRKRTFVLEKEPTVFLLFSGNR